MPCQITFEDGFYWVAGQLDATANLSVLKPILGVIRLNFRHLTGVNSIGLSKLLNFVHHGYLQFEYHECPKPFLGMVNAVPSLLGPKADPGVLKSVLLACFCEVCNQEKTPLILISDVRVTDRAVAAPAAACPTCGARLRFDDDPMDVFVFLLPKV